MARGSLLSEPINNIKAVTDGDKNNFSDSSPSPL